MDNPKHLGDALDAFNLTTADLPGIEEAWAARFGVLDQPEPEDEKAVFRRLHPEAAAWDTLVINQFIPRSDGGITVTFEFTVDDIEQDGYPDDCGSVTFTAEQGRELLLARENDTKVHTYRRLLEERTAYATGATPVWWLLAEDTNPQYTLQSAGSALVRARRQLEGAQTRVDQVERLRQALETTTRLTPEEEKEFSTVHLYARGVKPTSPAVEKDRWGKDERAVTVDEVNRVAEELAKTTPEAERMTAVFEEASALPDGPLRTYLLADRDPVFYETTEGTGRHTRKVKRSYVPTSDLVSEHKKAVKRHANATKERGSLRRKLAAIRKESAAEVKAATKVVKAAEADRDAAWAAGWPGTRTKVPAMPATGPAEW